MFAFIHFDGDALAHLALTQIFRDAPEWSRVASGETNFQPGDCIQTNQKCV